MISNSEESKIDFNLYSRQLGIIDVDTMKKLTKMNFLIIGLRGLGIEILKNLILEGPNTVDIYDPNYISMDDLNSNYFITEKDINKIRDETIIDRIKNINPNVNSKVLKDGINNSENSLEKELLFIISNIPNYNMIIISEFISKSILIKLNEECRKLNKGLIYTCSLGLCGFLFNDFGNEHIITSPFEEDDTFYPIKDIKQGEKTIIVLENSLEGFPRINDENFIKLTGIKGMLELNNDNIYKPKYLSASEYEININSTNFNKYTYGGFLKVICIPKILKFKTFDEDILNPMKDKKREFINIPYIGRRDIVHSIIFALYNNENEYKKENSTNKRSFIINSQLLPELNDIIISKKLTMIAKNYYDNSKNNKENWILAEDIYDDESQLEEFDENLANNLFLYLKAELPPIVSFLGGVVAQEIIKITGKFLPFNQWFEFEFNYLSKKYNKDIISKEINEKNEVSRYNEQIQIFGKDVQNKLASLNIFLVGCGAIGCEYLKNFTMMGISCKNDDNNGFLTITDFDKIELSNLNRQFLFRENNIGQFKSEVAKHLINIMNNSCQIKAYTNYVGIETENIFSDDFWENQDIIFNAVDNVKARMYISDKVSIHKKYNVDAGTLGVESSNCFFLKNISSTYKEQNFGKKEDEDNNGLTGMCTIHAFPTSIKHCIEWSRNEYSTIFSDFINELNQIISGDYEYLYKILFKKIFPFYKNLEIEDINNYFEILINKSYIKAIQYSYIKFKIKFNFYIKDILKEHPEDSKDKNGNNFYTGSKHIPIILDLNINEEIDNLILCYIKSYSNLIFDTFGLIKSQEELKLNDNEIKQICLNTNIPNYDNLNKKSLISKIKYDKQFCKNFIFDLKNKLLKKINNFNEFNLKEITFSKDNMINSQYNFIYACSNLRAINFQIPQCNFLKVRSISSKIIPSIITSNAVTTGLASMQLYLLARLMIEKDNNNNDILNNDEALKLFRNYYINMGVNSYQFSYLPKVLLHNEKNDIPKDWTEWDSIILNGPLTISEFISNIEEKYKVIIKSIHSEKSMIYNENDKKEIKNFKVEEIFEKITKATIKPNKKYLIFYLSAKTRDGIEVKMPRIRYNIFFNFIK